MGLHRRARGGRSACGGRLAVAGPAGLCSVSPALGRPEGVALQAEAMTGNSDPISRVRGRGRSQHRLAPIVDADARAARRGHRHADRR